MLLELYLEALLKDYVDFIVNGKFMAWKLPEYPIDLRYTEINKRLGVNIPLEKHIELCKKLEKEGVRVYRDALGNPYIVFRGELLDKLLEKVKEQSNKNKRKISVKEYIDALITVFAERHIKDVRWIDEWTAVPELPLDKFYKRINEILKVELTLEEHIKLCKKFAKYGIKYHYGGINIVKGQKSVKHWVSLTWTDIYGKETEYLKEFKRKVKELAKEFNNRKVDFKTYKTALMKAWEEYWKNIPPWYAPLEKLYKLINKHLLVELTLEEHLQYIKELAKWGKVDYFYGGLHPKWKHWVEVKSTLIN